MADKGNPKHFDKTGKISQPVNEEEIRIKTTRFPISAFWITLGILLLTAGLQTGLLLLMEWAEVSPIVEVHLILFYWILAAFLVIRGVQWRTK